MPAYYDKLTNKWYCKFYYTDWTGAKKQKKKRGFELKRLALDWERTFLDKQQGNPDMTFQALYEIYIEDIKTRIRETSVEGKKQLFRTRILPFFKDKPINKILPTDIRKWQNELINANYSDSYLDRLHNSLVAIFNFAVTYYNLTANPCHKAGRIGKRTVVVNFWTKGEYDTFIDTVGDIQTRTAFQVLYYSGVRIGELFALTLADIDTKNNAISVNKSFQRLKGKDVITLPKTPKSIRTITMPPFVINDLINYSKMLYELKNDDRLFPFTKHFIYNAMTRGCVASRVKRIRIHDIRHSHASLLIELGFSPLIISERLGHEKVETTLTTYSHLYPNKHNEVADKLQNLHNNSTVSVPQTSKE